MDNQDLERRILALEELARENAKFTGFLTSAIISLRSSLAEVGQRFGVPENEGSKRLQDLQQFLEYQSALKDSNEQRAAAFLGLTPAQVKKLPQERPKFLD